MVSINQDFTIYAGNSPAVTLQAVDSAGNPLDLTNTESMQWDCARDLQTTSALVKTLAGGGIAIPSGTNGFYKLLFASYETTALSGFYAHEAVVTLSGTTVQTVTLGRMDVGRAPLWSYSGDPSTSAKDAVRNLINDTVESQPQMMDAEIEWFVANFPNVYLAAAGAAQKLYSIYARKPTKRVGDFAINYSDIAKAYQSLYADLKAIGDTMGTTPYSGGISRSDKQQVDQNTDRVKPPFRLKQFDDRVGPWGGGGGYGDGDWYGDW